MGSCALKSENYIIHKLLNRQDCNHFTISMKLLVRYFRPMVYGNYTTIVFDNIDTEKTYVS